MYGFSTSWLDARKVNKYLVYFWLVTLIIYLPDDVLAAKWSGVESVTFIGDYSDNKLLTQPGDEKVTSAILDLGYTAKRETETTSLRINPVLKMRRYEGDLGSNADDQYLYTSFDISAERTILNINADYVRDTPLTSESQDTEVNESDKRRSKSNYNVFWSFQLNESVSTFASLGYTAVKHANTDLSGLVDYEYQTISSGVYKFVSKASKLKTTLYGTRFKADQVLNETDDAGLDVSLESAIDERLKFTANLSWHESLVKIGPDGEYLRDKRQGKLASLNLSSQLEKGKIEFSAKNEINPGSNGIVEQQNRYQLTFSYNITEYGRLIVSYLNTYVQNISNNSSFVDWEYRQSILEWYKRLSPGWSISSKYSYSWKKFDNTDQYFIANGLLFAVQYTGT